MLVLPHHPYALQQLPYVDPKQEYPVEPPQLPSVEIFTFGVVEDDAAGAGEDTMDVDDDLTVTEGDVTGTKDDVVGAADDFVIANDERTAAEEDFDDAEVDVAGAEDDLKTEDGFDDVEIDLMDEVQSPNPDWQPLPQYATVEPQYPLLEQQFPNAESLQIRSGDKKSAVVLWAREKSDDFI
ncbi:uncharacterized protein N0V89_007602 [Didymosphaeria variabile]|uniref:Uncharacterized protein n=1 Tax=Didymosphaeria variabile TaxID=1932322 RepID=A0A9W9CAC6_9PLEO|nr:uncharacterized protein N0V89_007602 [Didymosphaeria variabile]KAJ4352255.1 hypothetical protein N0V89_007602 [Didymosphaeria variabile]